MSGSGDSNVGNRNIYEAGDQRNYSAAEMHEKERLGEGKVCCLLLFAHLWHSISLLSHINE